MENKKDKVVFRRMAQVLITLLVQVLIIFVAAGTIQWLWAWVLFGINILIIIFNSKVLPKDLISERGNPKENVKNWDKVITFISIFPFFLNYILSGLDHRFHWTGQIPLWIHFLGLLFMVTGNLLFTWAMVSNQFFSTMVRIQDDRNHGVATAGPYKTVRHPGYTGFILQTLSIPLVLGTLWSLIPAGLMGILFVIRTNYEDFTLQKELNGYREYAEQVRYRLIPGIW